MNFTHEFHGISTEVTIFCSNHMADVFILDLGEILNLLNHLWSSRFCTKGVSELDLKEPFKLKDSTERDVVTSWKMGSDYKIIYFRSFQRDSWYRIHMNNPHYFNNSTIATKLKHIEVYNLSFRANPKERIS